MSNSDTPRTDSQCYDCTYRGDMGGEFTASAGKRDIYGDHVASDFARQLERELNEALARINELEEEMEDRALEAKEEYPDE